MVKELSVTCNMQTLFSLRNKVLHCNFLVNIIAELSFQVTTHFPNCAQFHNSLSWYSYGVCTW